MSKRYYLPYLFVFATTFGVHTAKAQEAIVTERPSQSNSGYVVTPGRLNIETGFQYQQSDGGDTKEITNGTTLLRYGVNEYFELRGSISQQRIEVGADGSDFEAVGFSPISLGVKMKLAEEAGWVPQLALTTMVALPGGNDAFESDHVIPNMRLSAQWSAGERGTIVFNQAMEWSGDTRKVTNAFTLLYAHGLLDDLTWFFETYAFFYKDSDDERTQSNVSDFRLDTGFAWLANNSIQLDVYGGVGLSDVSPDWFIAGGISFALFK